MRAVIGQFSGPYSAVRVAKTKAVFDAKCFLIYHPVFFLLSPRIVHFDDKRTKLCHLG